MKTKISAILIVTFFTVSTYSQTNQFTIGFSGTYPINWNTPTYDYSLAHTDWSWYSGLNMNLWAGWNIDGRHTAAITELDNNNLNAYFQPDTMIYHAALGRISLFEAEEDFTGRHKYTNNHSKGDPTDDIWNGVTQRVQFYDANGTTYDPPTPVLSAIDETCEQVLSGIPSQFVTNSQDPNLRWHIKPRMRIRSDDALDVFNIRNVAKIVVKSFNGTIVDEYIINTSRFRDTSLTTYDGRYLETYWNLPIIVTGDTLRYNGGPIPDFPLNYPVVSECGVDYEIQWYGQVDVWIDYVKVMDNTAHNLMGPNPRIREAIIREMNQLLNFDGLKGFYTEEVQYSNLRCLKYIQGLLSDSSGNDPRARLVCLINPPTYRHTLSDSWNPDNVQIYEAYADSVDPPAFIFAGYPWEYFFIPSRLPNTLPAFTFHNTYTQQTRDTINSYYGSIKISPPDYNTHIQNVWGRYKTELEKYSNIAHQRGQEFYVNTGIQGFRITGIDYAREPMMSELNASYGMALCYGATGIMQYAFESWISENTIQTHYNFGMLDSYTFDTTWQILMVEKRTQNLYGENKWDGVVQLHNKVKTWGPVLYNSTNTQGFSVHSQGADHGFITNILSIDPHRNDYNPCPNDGPSGPYYDCDQERFWEMGFFNTSEPSTKYFMMVNRRCVPAGGDFPGDDRVLRIKFDANDFPNFNSWIISEVGSTTSPVPFSRNYNGYVDIGSTNSDMGWFKPGEGKLFKIEAIPVKGGTLVADEVISGGSFTCEAPVYNNGFNITIGANTTIHFNDSSRFEMNGGVFTVGDQNTSAPQNITSDAVPGGSWRGHSFTNCEVKIYGATFTGLANDTTYAVNIIDCPVVDIRNCTFNTNSSLKGGVNAICFDNPFIAINNIYIGSNTFNSSGSTIPTVNVSSYAGVTTPLIIENNTFNEGNSAVFLSGVIGGAIKGNTIIDNYIGINALTSSIDVVQNNISSTVNGSMGIFAAGGSELKLNSSGTFTLGGLNNISNEGTGTNNINVDGSYFLLEGGENIFNISSDQSSYHLYGYFPMFTAVTTEETNNCFKVDDSPVDPPVNMVTSGYQGTQITFNFNPYLAGCEIIGGGDGLAIDLGNGIYDTIYTGGSGSGGSMKEALPLTKSKNRSLGGEYPQGEGVEMQTTPSGYAGHPSLVRRGAYTPQLAKEKYDSVCVLMRYRNYTQAKTKCLDLINTYPDSIQSIFAVSKLFFSTVANDTSYNAANTLKIFYENLILNHPGNTSLVKRANYYILKCKVRMREYSQALAGFQQIINLNPYSYEGLIARWDYMATSLLAPQGGSFGSAPTVSVRDNDSRLSIDLVNALQNEADGDDKNPFTKEQRQDIRKSINTAIEISKNDDEVKIKKLEDKSELGDVNASKELTQMKSLKQVVKTEKPKSIIEHVRIVSEDIRKVFGSNTSSKGNEPKNIPLVFRISQNYPNPFNPVTKINYDLPKDSKVKIVIYDILGREVKRLVNNELKTAGSYIVDFNAMNYASGVYFYRIEAEEPNGNKFVDSKKMVLLK